MRRRRRSARTDARKRPFRAAILAGLLYGLPALPASHAQEAPDRATLAAFGPWPPAADASAATPASRAAVALGEQLFFSPRLGDGGRVRCASCHEPWRGFVDGRPRALGLATGARNTPTLRDVATHRHYGWDGLRDELWRQALRPLDDSREMPASAAHVASLVRDDPVLAARCALAFEAPPAIDDAQVRRNVGRALAAYVETLASARTPFDDWRDARLAGSATPALPPPAQRGFALFVGRGGCAACHAGPGFSDDSAHASLIRSLETDGSADDGGGNAFRTPGLRNVAATGPWMHDGSVATLCAAVGPHVEDGAALSDAERADLVAFLQALGGDASGAAPRRCPAS